MNQEESIMLNQFDLDEKRHIVRRNIDHIVLRRVELIEKAIEQNTEEHKTIVEELQKVAEQTLHVANNTMEIVNIFKAIASIRSAILYGAPFVTALLGLFAFFGWLVTH